MTLIYDVSFDSGTRVLSLLDKAGNTISSCEVPLPLTLTSQEDGSTIWLFGNLAATTLSLAKYEVDTGNGWTSYSISDKPHLTLNRGESCRWRCSKRTGVQTASANVNFGMTGTFSASGCINSMIRPDFATITSLADYPYAFCQLFKGCASLVDVTALKLPAMTLSEGCYRSLFDTTKITLPPELPATTLAPDCYRSLFYGVTTLTRAPALPATTLADGCYYRMHYNNTALTEGQDLPATVLVSNCYGSLYSGCSNLAKVSIRAQNASASTMSNWLSSVAFNGNIYQDPSATILGAPRYWERWVYGATDTGETTTMYHNGTAETVRVGTSPYGICYSVSGWNGFKDLEGMHTQGYSLQEPTEVQMYHRGIEVTVYKLSANGADGFTENMYNVNNKFLTLSSMHNADYSYGVQTGITVYSMYEVPHSGVSCPANEDDGFTETMYAVNKEYGSWTAFLTLTDMENMDYFLSINDIPLVLKSLSTSVDNVPQVSLELYNTSSTSFLNTFEYRFSSSNQWSEISLGTPITMLQTMLIRMKSKGTEQDTNRFVRFVISGTNMDVQAYGNLNAMCSTTYKTLTRVPNFGLYALFSSCSQLTRAPRLPATSVGGYAYASLFSGTGIVEAPELPAMSLSSSCYYSMFYGTRITKSPLLPALTLAKDCYQGLFENCKSLTEVRMAATNVSANGCLVYWLKSVASSGTLYVPPNITLSQPSPSGVPSGWTRLPLSDYPTT